MLAATVTDPLFVIEEMPLFMQSLIRWLQGQPILTAYFFAVALDIVTGIGKAFLQKKMNSSISFVGGVKKTTALLLVALAAIFEPFAGGLPLSKVTCMYFLYHEGLSILENAKAMGVPIPKFLSDVLQKGVDNTNSGSTSVTTTTTTGATTIVNTSGPVVVPAVPVPVIAPVPPVEIK